MLLSQYKIYRKFKKRIKNKSGRNSSGHITVRHKGAWYKKTYRTLNWTVNLKNSLVIGLLPDKQNKKTILQVMDLNTRMIYFRTSSTKISPLDNIVSYNKYRLKEGFVEWRCTLNDLEIGDFINNLSKNPLQNTPSYIRAAGTVGQIIQKYTALSNYSLVQFPSGEQKLVLTNNTVNRGKLTNYTLQYETIKKAGRSRWLGKRPSVRGVAMNPIDHPHGGGQGKTSGGRPSVSIYGRLTKNVPTRKNKSITNWTVLKKRKKIKKK